MSYMPIGLGRSIYYKLGLNFSSLSSIIAELHDEMKESCSQSQFVCKLRYFQINYSWHPEKRLNRRDALYNVTHMLHEAKYKKLYNEYHCHSPVNVLKRAARSIFVVSPKGTHYDCFRHWESLLVGSIPIIDKHHSLDEIMKGLPYIAIPSFNWHQLSWKLLEDALENILGKNPEMYTLEKLLADYWIRIASTW
jgi:hypothetical protein